MTEHPPTKSHNYVAKIEALYGAGGFPRGSLSEIDVQHDDWCDALNGRGYCNCDPELIVDRKHEGQ